MLALMRPAPRIPARHLLLATLIAFALAWLLSRTEAGRTLEYEGLDGMTRIRTAFQPPPDPRIALVLFDDDSDSRLGAWPLDRQWHAEFMKLLYQTSPAEICWDVIFDANGKSSQGDDAMAAIAGALGQTGIPVVCAAMSSDDSAGIVPPTSDGPTRPFTNIVGAVSELEGHARAYLPYAALRKTATFAFADFNPEPDGVRRRIPIVVRVDGKVYPTLALQAALSLLKVKPAEVRVAIGRSITFPAQGRTWRIPIDDHGRIWINYRYDERGGRSAFPTYGYAKLMIGLDRHFARGDASEPVPDLKGKIVLIGQTVTGKADAGPTPLGRLSPFTLYHANLLNSILRSDYVRTAPAWLLWPAIALSFGAALVGASRRRLLWLVVVSVGGIALYPALALLAWVLHSLWLPLAGPLLGMTLASAFAVFRRVRDEQRAKEKVRHMFGSYLSPELLDRLVASGTDPEVTSERRPVAVLFSDLRDFTAWSERTPENILIAQLNEYLEAMVACVHAEGGTLHKFIGDAVMAAWGDMESRSPAEDCRRACAAALAMQRRLDGLNQGWLARNLHPLRMGIGINHGTVLVGNVGSPKRMEFTVIGDPVNLASRLESMNKALGTSILVGESVESLAGGDFQFVPKGELPVKGKAEPIRVFELLARPAAQARASQGFVDGPAAPAIDLPDGSSH
ncbi:adenylate cyclase 1 [mine drainage metagenome]|uniref:Adenylate cyclase 1 n=1 Tax=mine drainage metagenome TaxID=410659 RepID=A0A1J5TYD7_9ZZZZ